MNPADRQLHDMVHEIAMASKDEATRYVEHKVVVEAVEERMAAGGLPLSAMQDLIHRAAEAEVRRYFARSKPKISAQLGIYLPQLWLPLGAGKRVQMGDASRLDLTTWGQGIQSNRRRVNRAADDAEVYVQQRTTAWDDHPGRPLHWVETRVFGFTPGAVDPEEYLYETEEDDR